MIYLFNNKEELIRIVRKEAIISLRHIQTLTDTSYVSDRLKVEMKALSDDLLSEIAYLAIPVKEDRTKYHLFFVAEDETYDNVTTMECVQSGIEELRKSYVEDHQFRKASLTTVLNHIMTGSNWQIRYSPDVPNRTIYFYFTSAFDGLLKVCDKWHLEMQFFVEMNNNHIGARYIDLKQQIGKRTGARVVYGHNALKIIKKSEKAEFYTAVIGLGNAPIVSFKEETGNLRDGYGRKLHFKDVVWTKPTNPLDKPRGVPYLELTELTRKYGIKHGDVMLPRIGKVEFDTDDVNELIQLTYDYLIANTHPKVTFSTTAAYLKGEIGDTIRVVRTDRKLDYETRIFEIEWDRLEDRTVEIKLGDRIAQSDSLQALETRRTMEDISVASSRQVLSEAFTQLPSANKLTTNWYQQDEPPNNKVKVGDLWYKPDVTKAGEHILYTWNGEHWVELIRTADVLSKSDKLLFDIRILNLKKDIQSKAQAQESERVQLLGKVNLNTNSLNETKELINSLRGKIDREGEKNKTLGESFAAYQRSMEGRLESLARVTPTETDFAKIKTSAILFEQLFGRTENDVVTNISRQVLTSELFEREVTKVMGNVNLIENSAFPENTDGWGGFNPDGNPKLIVVKAHQYLNGTKPMFAILNKTDANTIAAATNRFSVKRRTKYTLSMKIYSGASYLKKFAVFLMGRRSGETEEYSSYKALKVGTSSDISELRDFNFTFTTEDIDEAYIRIEHRGGRLGTVGSTLYFTELDLHEGDFVRPWQPAPKIGAIKTRVDQLAGSYAIQNLTSAGEVLNSINLLADGTNLFDGRLTHITGQTVIDDAVIESAKLKTVSADKIVGGTADFAKIRAINLDARSVTSGTFTGLTFKGGKILSTNGNMEIDLLNNITRYHGTAGIIFESPGNYLKFSKGGSVSFLLPTVKKGTDKASICLGVNSKNELNPSKNFVGLKFFNDNEDRYIYTKGDIGIEIPHELSDDFIFYVSLQKVISSLVKNVVYLRSRVDQRYPTSIKFVDDILLKSVIKEPEIIYC